MYNFYIPSFALYSYILRILMTNTLIYVRFGYKTFLFIFALTVLPFTALRLYGFDLKELPFMFLALLGLMKFYLASLQTDKGIQAKIKAEMGTQASKQDLVNKIKAFKTGQDLALLANAVLILILNIILPAILPAIQS